MGISNNAQLATVAMILAGILILSTNVTIEKVAAGGEACQGDLQGLITQCAMYVQKPGPIRDPSPGCCNVIASVDIPCVCKYISKDIEGVVDMDKVVHVAQFCGKPLPHAVKCGSYTVP